MVKFHRQALCFCLFIGAASAFTGSGPRSPLAPRAATAAGKHRQHQYQRSFTRIYLHTQLDNNGDAILARALASNDLNAIVAHLQAHAASIPSLTPSQLQAIFVAVERATADSDANTVNKRALEDANLTPDVEFQTVDRARAQMTTLYRLLRAGGRLRAFGAVGRGPPAAATAPSPPGDPVYPAGGSKLIAPELLGRIARANGLELDMVNLTPRPTNFLLYGGAVLAVAEGAASLATGVNFNFLVACTLLLAVLDQLLVSGAVSDTALRLAQPGMTARITRHEAGHFLAAYLLGCPVEGVVLSTWDALRDGRFGGRSAAVSAGTSYFDLDLSEQIAGRRPLTRASIDRYSVIVMAGIAAEAVEYGAADGGAGDEDALVRFLRSLNPRSGNAVSAWTPELIRNQARWGATQSVLLLREYKPCYDALVAALEGGGDLGQCIVAIEEAAAEAGLGWLRRPLGRVLEGGECGRWVPSNDDDGALGSLEDAQSGEGDTRQSYGVASIPADATNGVPTYGDEPITSTEEFLEMYRGVMEKKLALIDEQLEEMDSEK